MTTAGAEVPLVPTTHSGQRQRVAVGLLAGVALTLGAIAGYDLIPAVRFDVTRVPNAETGLSFTPVPGREQTGEWLDDSSAACAATIRQGPTSRITTARSTISSGPAPATAWTCRATRMWR